MRQLNGVIDRKQHTSVCGAYALAAEPPAGFYLAPRVSLRQGKIVRGWTDDEDSQ